MKRILIGGLVLLAIGCSGGSALEVGSVAPELTAETLADAKPVKLADYKGKVVVLDFWATWCGPCIEAMPHLVKTQEKYGDRVAVLPISNEDKATIGEFLSKKPMKLNFIRDPFQETMAAYDVSGFPTTFIIGKDGKIAFKSIGFDETGFDQAIAEAVK